MSLPTFAQTNLQTADYRTPRAERLVPVAVDPLKQARLDFDTAWQLYLDAPSDLSLERAKAAWLVATHEEAHEAERIAAARAHVAETLARRDPSCPF